ncbi:anti-sigma factor [Rhizobium sp. LC145]|uniref:anti-sigma factor family protein n=1 Tax=Rhizobium sp. LC145 TaxID=1120688 RepID=UPI00062A4535|nr:anti-sigma factor [Rhizobium sp. LC145]KKX32912.1 transmembrane transcriptional regulator (anti-sigma factor) [Rhizobium sp. LC145]TKT57324.1 anti-sigma factor [Rhizobiaceae bacterium LC148]
MTDVETILDTDLDAYVDNQLDAAGRLRVESYLAQHPAAAARVMSDLGTRTMLKLILVPQPEACRPDTREAARRLSSVLSGRRMWAALQRVAAVAVLVSAGWFANSSLGTREVVASVPPPVFIEQAVRAHQTSLVREAMPSQPEVNTYDREDIRAATAIVMPDLPTDWQISDVQVFPSSYGPSVEVSIRTKDGTQISLFAVRPGHFAVEQVKNLTLAEAEAAWWQLGEVAYAVISSKPGTGLSDEADLLMNSLY